MVSNACSCAEARDFFIADFHTNGIGNTVNGKYHIQVSIDSPISRSYHTKLYINESVKGSPGHTVTINNTAKIAGILGRIFNEKRTFSSATLITKSESNGIP